jgi:hypothetical protein
MLAFLVHAAFAADPAAPPAEPITQSKPVYEGRVTPESPHYDLEVLYDEGRFKEGHEIAEKRLAENPKDANLYWFLIRFMFEEAEQIDRKDKKFDKLGWYQKMVDLANKGLQVDPTNKHLKFARGIAYGRLGTTKGVLASLRTIKGIQDDWLDVVNSNFRYSSLSGQEVLPCDAEIGLSIEYRLVPDYWIIQQLSGMRGSPEKAVKYAEMADQCTPNRIGSRKELGVAQVCLGQRRKDSAMVAKGVSTLYSVLALPVVDEKGTDAIDQKHVRMILNDLDLACDYSRDGQQDKVSEEQVKPG